MRGRRDPAGGRGDHVGRSREGNALGRAGEARAEEYLLRQGYTLLARNYRCRGGEVDLVVADGATVVFVEVKTRRGTSWGSPLEAVDARKQRRLATAAWHFLLGRCRSAQPVRFDVVAVVWRQDVPEVEHVRNAFEPG